MTVHPTALGLILAMTSFANGAYAHPTGCENLAIPDCRERFIRSNMPKPHRPELQYGDESDLYIQIGVDMTAAENLESEQTRAQKALEKADGYVFSAASLDSWRRYFGRERARDVDAYNEASRRLADIQVRKHQKYNDAIAKTIELYHLTPKITQPIDHPNAVMQEPSVKPWAPHFSEAETIDKSTGVRRPFSDQERREGWRMRGVIIPDDQPAPPLVSGGTDGDQASVAIFAAAFTSPEALAASIFHETVHWLDLNSVGRPFYAYEHDESEVFAYGLTLAQRQTFNISEDRANVLKSFQEIYRRQAKKDSLSKGERRSHPGWLPSANIDIPPASRIVSPDGKRGNDLDRIVAQALRMARQHAIAQQAAKAAAHDALYAAGQAVSGIEPEVHMNPAPMAAAPVIPRTSPTPQFPKQVYAADDLRALAVKVCQDPNSVTKHDMISIGFLQYGLQRPNGQVGRAEDSPGYQENRDELSGCPLQVFDGIIALVNRYDRISDIGSITQDMVSALARRALNPAPTYSPRRRRDDDDPPPEEPKCHYENMGECCGGWVRICPG